MFISKIRTATFDGLEAIPVVVETSVTPGIGIHLVGLADRALKESLLRVITALQSYGFRIPGKKIVINLAPADLSKSGSSYDLPIALGILASSEQITPDNHIGDYIIAGELGLDGTVRTIPGGLVIASQAHKEGKRCILPRMSATEAAAVGCGRDVYAVDSLADVITLVTTGVGITADDAYSQMSPTTIAPSPSSGAMLSAGNRDALAIAAAGNLNVSLLGAETLSSQEYFANALLSLLPPLSHQELFKVASVYSVIGHCDSVDDLVQRKKNFLHSAIPGASLVERVGGGGGDTVRPGIVSLAHKGVLLLMDSEKLPKQSNISLACVMKDKIVTIARLRKIVQYPADFVLVMTSYGNDELSRMVDMQVTYEANGSTNTNHARYSFADVLRARTAQLRKLDGTDYECYGDIPHDKVEELIPLPAGCKEHIIDLMTERNIGAQAFTHIVKIAATLSDLKGEETISDDSVFEALKFRFLD